MILLQGGRIRIACAGTLTVFVLAAWLIRSAVGELPYNAQGELVGEVTPASAIVRARLTLHPERNPSVEAEGQKRPEWIPWSPEISEDVPGKEGCVRLHYATDPEFSESRVTPWAKVDKEHDYSFQFRLTGLTPSTKYHYRVELANDEEDTTTRLGEPGSFKTAPPPATFSPLRFSVTACQAMRSRDILREGVPWGFKTYESIARLRPAFHLFAGDNVYYDQDLYLATDMDLARYHWHRMYSLPCLRDLFRMTPGYWEKDDHDYRWNDSDPYQKVPRRVGPAVSTITDEMGRQLFREAVPMGDRTYRTFIWGKGLQIWLTEGRDYRSPNSMPDGPEKTLWGEDQKAWLKKGLLESPCYFKVLISPTPLVGPDRQEKRDNHANRNGFWTEGREFLRWAKESNLRNFFIICGDRHWQYHSIDETGVEEFSCGAISDRHAARNQPHWGKDRQPHFRDGKGGFLLVEVATAASGPELKFIFCDVDGNPVYTCSRPYRAGM